MARGAYIGISNFTKRDLPAGYTQIEYIESSTTQYINTGFIPNQDTRIVAEMEYVTHSDATCGLFGENHTSGVTNAFEFYFYSGGYYFNYGSRQYFSAGSGTTPPIGKKILIDLSKNSATFTIDGIAFDITPQTAETFTGDYELFIHSLDRSYSTYLSNSRTYPFKIYGNGVDLDRDYVPCIYDDTGAIGLYDFVSGTFYGVKGTGTFVAGTDKSSAARKIKSGYIGINTELPVYGESIGTVNLTASNISEYFEVENGTYYFKGNEATFTSNNKGKSNTTATSVWTAKNDMTNVSFDYSVSSYSTNKLTIKVNNVVVANAISGNKSSTWSGSLLAGEKIELSYVRGSYSSSSYDDCGILSNMTFTSKVKVQIGTEFKNIARRIKAAYIGIGGIARPCWSIGELSYYGTATSLSRARAYLAATNVGDYALVGGGATTGINVSTSISSTYLSNVVDAYDKTLTRSTPTALKTKRYWLAAASSENYAAFIGGFTNNGPVTSIDIYDEALTRTNNITLRSSSGLGSAIRFKNYILYAGGKESSSGTSTSISIFDENFTNIDINSVRLSQGRSDLSATTVGDYALFAGGNNSNDSSTNDYGRGVGSDSSTKYTTVDAINSLLTRTTATSLGTGRSAMASVTIGNHALFAGGKAYNDTNAVDAYDDTLTRTQPENLASNKCYPSSATIGDYGLICGGGSQKTSDSVEVYDMALTKTIFDSLSQARNELSATTIGNYVLFAGGNASHSGTSMSGVVDVYTVI